MNIGIDITKIKENFFGTYPFDVDFQSNPNLINS